MISSSYEFNYGLSFVNEETQKEIENILDNIKPTIRRNGVSFINKDIKNCLSKNGWIENYMLSLDSKISIPFFRDGVGVCIQTGNISRIYADMLKLQALFLNQKIKVGIIIVPHIRIAKLLGSNMANFERLVRELNIFKDVITLPLIIYGFDEENV